MWLSLLRCGFSIQPNEDVKPVIYPDWFPDLFLTWDPSASASLLLRLQVKSILFNTLTQFSYSQSHCDDFPVF